MGLALGDFAQKNKRVYVASEPRSPTRWGLGKRKPNRYTFRVRPSTYMQAAMLVEEEKRRRCRPNAGRRLRNYEYGQSAVASFKELLKGQTARCGVCRRAVASAGQAGQPAPRCKPRCKSKPDAIFNVTFGADLAKLVREGNQRGIFPKTPVVSLLSGEPEYLDVLKDETPKGWIVTGYPWDEIDSAPEHASFAANYYRRFKEFYVSDKAVKTEGTKSYVDVKNSDGTIEKREVKNRILQWCKR